MSVCLEEVSTNEGGCVCPEEVLATGVFVMGVSSREWVCLKKVSAKSGFLEVVSARRNVCLGKMYTQEGGWGDGYLPWGCCLSGDEF